MPEHACLAARTPFHPRSVRPAVLSLAIASAFAAPTALVQAQTLPAGGVAVHGQAAISNPSANQLRVVTQNGIGTRHSAIDWQSFSISSGSRAVFVQPDAGSTSINRVVTNTPSSIFGALSSNGRLVLVNQSGIAVGAGAVVDTAGFTASALRMSDADALAGRLRFGDANASMGGAAGITVGGRITARDGDVVLVAPNIDVGTSALVQAPNGSTLLAAGQQVEITGRGLEGITLLVQAPTNEARNLGRLEGDAVGIFAGTLRHSGEIQATTATMEGGRVVLRAAADAVVDGAGSILATGRLGGRVDVLGNRVAVADQAVIDVSGAQGGGTIRVGGDYQGKNAALPNAQMTYLGTDASLKADAIDSGDGGRVIVWADDVTRAYGSLSANAGLAGGNGGLVETSGHRYLDANGARVTAGGSGGGLGGTWLLDPASITITHAASAGPLGNMTGQTFVFGSGTVGFFAPVDSVATSTMTDANINAALNTNSLISLTIQTSQSVSGGGAGDITFDGTANGPIVIDRSNNGGSTTAVSLILNADRNIVFGPGTTTFQRSGASTGKSLVVELNPGITAAGSVQTSAGASVVMNGNNDELGLTVKNGKVWNNAGAVAMNGQSIIRLPNQGGYATFNNLATGALNVNTSGTWSFLSDTNPQGGIVNNAGTINVNGIAGGNSTSWEAFYSNLAGGVLHLGAGKLLSMQNAATLGGSLVLDSGSELRLSQQFIGTPAISNATFSGSGKLSVASGVTANFSNNSGTLGELDIQGTVSTLAGTLTVGDYVQSGGSFGGSAGLTVTKSFSHTGGSFAPTGDVSITQATGGLVFNESAALNALTLSAPTGGISFSGALTVNTNLGLSAGGAINQTAGSLVVNGATTLNAPGNVVDLSPGSNDFLSIAGSTGALTVVDTNSLVVGAAGINSSNGNVSLSATGIGSLTLSGNVNTGTGNLLLSATGGSGITQAAGTSITAAGTTTIAAGPAGAVTLTESGNNFGTVTATGGAISLRDVNAINLGAVNAGTSLAVNANGNVTQSAAVLVSGTTVINAGTGNVTLATAGNNLNSLGVAGNAINVVEGAGSSLTVTSLSSGANQPVSIAAGHTLTLPGTPINTGTANLSLSSGIGPLTIPAALSGNNITLAAVTGLTVNAPISATGNINANVSNAASVTTINADAIAGGTMGLTLAGGLELPAVNQSVRLGAGTGQSINAKYVALTVTGSGTSEIYNVSGPQTITTSGVNGAGEGLLVKNTGTGADTAGIYNAAGLQTITVNNANFVRVLGTGGEAFILSDGGQTLVIQGASSANTLQVGSASSVDYSEIRGNNQSITVGQPGQSGSIQIVAGTADDRDSGIGNETGTQTVKTVGSITIQGGSAPGLAGLDCLSTGGAHVGACGYIGQDGAGLQTVSAAAFNLNGGTSNSGNLAVIGSRVSAGPQLIEVTGGGNLTLAAGSGPGSGNRALIHAAGPSQTINFVSGGNLSITGGAGGSKHIAGVYSSAVGSLQSVAGATGISLTAGASGGGFGIGNSARLESVGNQSITVGVGGLTLTGGGGTGAETDNDAQVWQSGGAGTTQSVTVNGGGAITIVGGSSAKVNVGGSGHGSKAKIQADGTSQTINFTAGGAINLTGGTNGSRAFAMIESVNGSQTISGAPNITMVGGANGGVDGEGNRAVITASAGAQTITAGNVVVRGGASGIENRSVIFGALGQNLTATGLAMFGGVAGGGFNDGNLAYIGTGNNASQLINLGTGGLQMTGGGGALSDNAAQIEQLGTGTQTINSNGAIVMAGGSSAGVNVGGSGHGSRASIYSEGSTQTINMLGANRSISLTGGTVGSRNFAQIFAENTGNQVINGASSITLAGGTSGGVVGEGNSAYISANSGSQTIAATSINLTGGAAGTENLATIQQSSSTGATTGTQSITIGGGGAVTLQGGGGTTNLARIRSFGATQTLNYSAGGALSLTGGTGASLDFARVEAVNGNQNILGSPNIALAGGAGGGADLNGNFASITANSATATQTIVSSAMTLNAGAAGINNYAVITAPVQNLTVHGNLAITGGGSAASLDGTTGGGARIGANGGATSTLTLAVDNNITLTGGSVAGAAIGSNVQGGTSTAISITAGGNVTLNPGSAPTAGARIGSPAAGPAAGDIMVIAGGSIGLNGAVAGETAVRTLGKVKLEGNTLAIGNAVSGSEVDLHGLAGVSLSGVAAVSATATSGNSLEVVVDSGAFSNTAGASALTAAVGGRWLVYSVDPANDTRGGLVPAFKQYDAVPGDTVLGSGSGFLYSVVPTATASLVGPISKAYDGGLGAALTGANYSVTGIDGDVVLLNNPASGSYDNKNVGSGKTVTATGLVVASASNAGIPVFGYNPSVAPATGAVGSIGIASLVVSTLDVNKTYDGGTTAAGAAVISSGSLFGSDTLSGGTFAFTNKNVGTGKTVTVAGISVNDGNGGANYSLSFANNTTSSISQLPLATWTGGAGNNLWSSAGNWAGGAIPDGANVAVVSIPAGSGDVVFDSAVPATSLQSLASARPLGIGSGSLQVATSLAVADFSQTGGALGGAGSLSVGNSFSQTGGSIVMGGPISIAQNSGNLGFSSLQAPSVSLAAPAGSISQTGPVITGTLVTVSQTGTALTQSGNQIGALLAQNLGSGDILVTNGGPLAVVGIDNAGGHIALTNTGPLHTLGPVVARAGHISLIAANPGGNLTLDGAVVASDQVYLRADNLLTQNGAVVGPNGVLAEAGIGPIGFGLLAAAIGSPVDYRVAGVSVTPPPSEISVAALLKEVQSAAAAPLVVFAEQFKEIVAAAKVKDLLDTNADGSRKNKRTDDTIVTEGDICR